jgi:hypothetical protein
MESDKESDVSEKPSEIPWLEQLKGNLKVVNEKGKNVSVDVHTMPSKENATDHFKHQPCKPDETCKGQLKFSKYQRPTGVIIQPVSLSLLTQIVCLW